MNKSELIAILADRLSQSQSETKKLLDSVFTIFREQLAKHDRFTIPGFGTFDTAEHRHHIAYNPHYKKKMLFPKKIVAVFRPAKALQEKINQE